MFTPMIAGLGAQELILILLVLVLLFGATKLPELARGSGRALRIFKAETKGLMDDDDDKTAPAEPVQPAPLNRAGEPVEAEIVDETTPSRAPRDNA